MTSKDEKRLFLRVQITLEVRVAGPAGVAYGRLRDISRGNASFFLDEPVGNLGDSLDVFLPFSEKDEVAVMGELIRVEETNRGNLHAIRFALVEPSMRKTLDEFLEHALALRGSESRKHPRIAVQVPVLFRDPAEHRATLETIALGGLSMTADKPIDLHREIEIEIPWPVAETPPRPPLLFQGEVVSTFPAIEKGTRKYRIGAKFNHVTDDQRRVINIFIRTVLGIIPTS